MHWPLFVVAWAAAECEEPPALQLLQQKARKSEGQLLDRASFSKYEPCKGPVQVLTDVDDTFMSSGGSWPAGCDGVYKKGVIYPGFAQFLVELARGPEEDFFVLRPAIFSARPESLGWMLKVDHSSPLSGALNPKEGKDDPANWDQFNAEIKIDVPPNLTAYSYQNGGFEKVITHADGHPFTNFGLNVAGSKYGHMDDFVDFGKMGETKFENFQEIFLEEAARDSSKVCAIFIGDDGQGDCMPASEKMRKWLKPGTQELALKAAFIHSLTCDEKPMCSVEKATLGGAPRMLFKTYLDAAMQAQKMDLISKAGYGRVRAAVELFFKVYCAEDGSSKAPETLGKLGCEQLWTSLQADPPAAENITHLETEIRPARRFEAFCSHCCNGDYSNHRGSYDFDRKSFRCHNMFHTTSWWRPSFGGASNGACRSHCSSV